MTIVSILPALPADRLLALEADRLAEFIRSEASYISKKCDRFIARAENRVIERVLLKRLKKAFRSENTPEDLTAYLHQMRQDYAAGRKETFSVFTQASESLEFYDEAQNLYESTEATYHPPPWRKQGRQNKPSLLYVVGGGFILPPSRREREMVERLAKACNCDPVLGRHRLAPEDPFPAGAEDIVKQYLDLLKVRGSAKNIFVAADTAGASLLMGALQILRKDEKPMPAGVLLFSPWCDLSLSGWSYITQSANADSPFRMETAAFCARLYLQDTESAHPLASAIFADLTGFPSMAIHTSQYDMHFDDAITLAEKAKASGVECHLNYWDTPRHHLERLKSKDAQKSYEIAAGFIERVLSRRTGHSIPNHQ